MRSMRKKILIIKNDFFTFLRLYDYENCNKFG